MPWQPPPRKRLKASARRKNSRKSPLPASSAGPAVDKIYAPAQTAFYRKISAIALKGYQPVLIVAI
jgi:hypothetical protein